MQVRNVYYSSRFENSLKKFTQFEQRKIKEKIQLFLKDPLNSQLKTHKLTGKLKNYWSFSITYELRIMFEFIDSSTVGLVDIGTHEVYR